MNFKSWLINEMPINNFQLMGKWGEKDKLYGYKRDDIGILTSPKGVEKIKKQWFKTEEQFDFYFLRSPAGKKVMEVGEVSPEYIKNVLLVDLQPNPESITVVFTNNVGTERIPMNGWAIAHRFGHAIRKTEEWTRFSNEFMTTWKTILKDVYNFDAKLTSSQDKGRIEKLWPYRDFGLESQNHMTTDKIFKILSTTLGTMKSAREGKLLNFYEFQHELLAQFLLTGSIKFNPLPMSLVTKYAWGRPSSSYRSIMSKEDLDDFNDYLAGTARTFEYYLKECLNSLAGKIFVM